MDTYSNDYLVVKDVTVRTAHTAITYIDVSDSTHIKELHLEYGNSVQLDTHRGAVLDITYGKHL